MVSSGRETSLSRGIEAVGGCRLISGGTERTRLGWMLCYVCVQSICSDHGPESGEFGWVWTNGVQTLAVTPSSLWFRVMLGVPSWAELPAHHTLQWLRVILAELGVGLPSSTIHLPWNRGFQFHQMGSQWPHPTPSRVSN